MIHLTSDRDNWIVDEKGKTLMSNLIDNDSIPHFQEELFPKMKKIMGQWCEATIKKIDPFWYISYFNGYQLLIDAWTDLNFSQSILSQVAF